MLFLSFKKAGLAQLFANKIPDIIKTHPQIERLVVHVGVNDTSKPRSEILKSDFCHLFDVLSSLVEYLFQVLSPP